MCNLTCINVCTHRDKYILHLFTDELFSLPHLSGVNDAAFKHFHFTDLNHDPHTGSESTLSTEPSPKPNTGWLLRKIMTIFFIKKKFRNTKEPSFARPALPQCIRQQTDHIH